MNAMLLPAAITHVRRITVSYPSVDSSIRYSNVTIACIVCMRMTAVTLGNRFLSVTESQALAFGYRQYGRPILAIAGILVFQDAGCIYVLLQVWSRCF